MKALVCEMCNSQDLVKQDGMYVCQSCGTKYTVEEAKKLLVEGTVKIDNSEELKNLYQIARRAKDDNNGENAAKYYDMILVKDPTSWEASFYVVYFKATECKIAQIASAAYSVKNCIGTVLNLIKDYVPDLEEQKKDVAEVVLRCSLISSMLFNGAMNHYNGISKDIQQNYNQETLDRLCAARDILYTLGNTIEEKFGDDTALCEAAAEAWKLGIEQHKKSMPLFANKTANHNIILDYAKKINKYDSSYTAPAFDSSSGNSGGCYVATAVYGSYDCPQVWTLRRYRDNTLAKTWYGLLFIYLYYTFSPTLVRWFGNKAWFKNMWKPKLDRMVKRLNDEGVEDTPYNDKRW